MEPTHRERFEAMFRENYASVRGYVLRRAPREMAQDAVAETFLVAWRKLDEVPQDSLPWLYAVARRVLANERRAAGRREKLARRVASAEVAAGEVADSLADAELIRAALERLTERDREALTLVAWHGLSSARAAKAAECSRGTFAVRLHRARNKLAAELRSLEDLAQPAETDSLEVT